MPGKGQKLALSWHSCKMSKNLALNLALSFRISMIIIHLFDFKGAFKNYISALGGEGGQGTLTDSTDAFMGGVGGPR